MYFVMLRGWTLGEPPLKVHEAEDMEEAKKMARGVGHDGIAVKVGRRVGHYIPNAFVARPFGPDDLIREYTPVFSLKRGRHTNRGEAISELHKRHGEGAEVVRDERGRRLYLRKGA